MRKLTNSLLVQLICIKFSFSQSLSPSEFLINSTIKIESTDTIISNGKKIVYTTSGTGFFFRFHTTKWDNVPVIVTNKHVVKNAQKGTLYFKVSDSTGFPSYNNIEKIQIYNFKDQWIYHPDSTIDLAILPIAPLLTRYNKLGKNLFYADYLEDYIPNESDEKTLCSIEDIIMIGYPFGLRDTKNDIPIIRKGITATPPYLNYDLKSEFLIDIPVYGGSSGSPVIIYNPMTYTTRDGSYYMKSRLYLLGINYATYTRDFEGKITPKESINIQDSMKVNTAIPYNIGIVIKSQKLLDFKSILNKMN